MHLLAEKISQLSGRFRFVIQDHFHLLFRSSADNHLRIQQCRQSLDGKFACVVSFDSYSDLKRYQKKFRTITVSLSSAIAMVIVAVIATPFLMNPNRSSAASFLYKQAGWTTGAAGGTTATYPANNDNFTDYTAKNNIDVANAGADLTMSAPTSSSTGDASYSGTPTGFYVVGGVLKLLKPNGASCGSEGSSAECASDYCSTTCQAFTCGADTVTDIDGNAYNTVSFGSQCWTKENMMTTKYPDGTSITRGPTGATWSGDNAYYAYPPNTANTSEETLANINTNKLGFVYQWSAATKGGTSQGICPNGWHVPTDQEYMTMEEFLGMCTGDGADCSGATGWRGSSASVGSKLSTETSGGTNSSDFTAHLAGYRDTDGSFGYRSTNAYFWSSSPYSASNAWRRYLRSGYATVGRGTFTKASAWSVRCLNN